MTPAEVEREQKPVLSEWPVDRPQRWRWLVNQPQPSTEEEALRRAVQRGRPFGSVTWEKQAATRLRLESTMRPRGRPRIKRKE